MPHADLVSTLTLIDRDLASLESAMDLIDQALAGCDEASEYAEAENAHFMALFHEAEALRRFRATILAA